MKTQDRKALMRGVRRVVVKIGTSLSWDPEKGIDPTNLEALAAEIAKFCKDGLEVVMVASGAIGAGHVPPCPEQAPDRHAGEAGHRGRGPGLPDGAGGLGVPAPRAERRAGADLPPGFGERAALLQRPQHPGHPGAHGRGAGHQRERHRGGGRDQVRRQRPPGGPGLQPGEGRPARHPHGRGRPARKRPAQGSQGQARAPGHQDHGRPAGLGRRPGLAWWARAAC